MFSARTGNHFHFNNSNSKMICCHGYMDGFCAVVMVTGMVSVLLSWLQGWFLCCCHGYRDGICAVVMFTGMVSVLLSWLQG